MNWSAIAAVFLALAVILGAFGAHGLKDRLDAYSCLLYTSIRGVLEANGIASVLSRSPYATLGVEVRVAREDLERSQSLIAEALAAGPEAAAEAEAESEEGQ